MRKLTSIRQIKSALSFWESGEGRPYRGSLIDRSAYEENPDGLGCMCAQGQVLVLSGKRSIEELLEGLEQTQADKDVASVLNISLTHSILLRNINDSVEGAPSVVITDPEKVLGDKWSYVLDFWWMLDSFTLKQWTAARAAARAAAGDAARAAARAAAGDAARAAAEIQGFHLLERRPFLNAFGFNSLGDIPKRPGNYGLGVVPQVQP